MKKDFNILLTIVYLNPKKSLECLFERGTRSLASVHGSSFYQRVQNHVSSFNCFRDVFLFGWIAPSKQHEGDGVKGMNINFENQLYNCRLPILNKLGKYRSIAIKKVIADYAGVEYGYELRRKLISVAKAIGDRPSKYYSR